MSLKLHLLISASYACVAAGLGLFLQISGVVDATVSWIIAGGLVLAGFQVQALGVSLFDKAMLMRELTALRTAHSSMSDVLWSAQDALEDLSERYEMDAIARDRQRTSEFKMLKDLVGRLEDHMRSHEDGPAGDKGEAGPGAPESDEVLLQVIRSALEKNRLDLYLQPIVSLPQRRLRFYEGLSRLRREDGRLMMPDEYLGVAERSNLMAVIDNLLLFRCVQIVRRLARRNRDIGLLCNMSNHSLNDEDFFPQFLEFLKLHTDLSGQITFEFGQITFERSTPREMANLRALADLGFRFSLDKVVSLDLDPHYLHERSFRFVKIPAALLLDPDARAAARIDPADMKTHLSRYGLDLIAERIETERDLVEVLEYDVDFGQGYLFGRPAPISESVLGVRTKQPEDARPA